MPEVTLTTLAPHVALLTLNQPDNRNALTDNMRSALNDALTTIESDQEIRVAIMTGEGPAFCSGGDLQSMKKLHATTLPESARRSRYLNRSASLVQRVFSLAKPLIAAVNGAAVGAGMSLALLADIRIASTDARFGQVFVKRGLMPDFGGLFLLPELIGIGLANELFLTGRLIDSHEALDLKLVNRVVPNEILIDESLKLAQEIARNAPLAVQATKIALNTLRQSSLTMALYQEAQSQPRLQISHDHEEGIQAYFEGRTPIFEGD